MVNLRKPIACPACGASEIAQIIYGQPTSELLAELQGSDYLTGGCVIQVGQPDWLCRRCSHRWFDATDPARQELDEMLLAMIRRGRMPSN